MWRCEGPHCFAQKRPRTFASALQRVAAVEASKNPLSRDFRYRSIFDFCNNICQQQNSLTDQAAVTSSACSIRPQGPGDGGSWREIDEVGRRRRPLLIAYPSVNREAVQSINHE